MPIGLRWCGPAAKATALGAAAARILAHRKTLSGLSNDLTHAVAAIRKPIDYEGGQRLLEQSTLCLRNKRNRLYARLKMVRKQPAQGWLQLRTVP